MRKLCFDNEEVRECFYRSITPFEARLFIQKVSSLEPGTYSIRYPNLGVSERGVCIVAVFEIEHDGALVVESVERLHQGGVIGLLWNIRGMADTILGWCLKRLNSKYEQ